MMSSFTSKWKISSFCSFIRLSNEVAFIKAKMYQKKHLRNKIFDAYNQAKTQLNRKQQKREKMDFHLQMWILFDGGATIGYSPCFRLRFFDKIKASILLFVSVLCSAVVCIYALVVILFVAIIYAYKRIFTPVNIVINIKVVNESVQLFFARSYHVWINNYIKIIIDFAIWLLQHENDTLDCNMRWAKGYTSLQNLSFKFYGHIKCCQ